MILITLSQFNLTYCTLTTSFGSKVEEDFIYRRTIIFTQKTIEE
jgi:hypothetical protein